MFDLEHEPDFAAMSAKYMTLSPENKAIVRSMVRRVIDAFSNIPDDITDEAEAILMNEMELIWIEIEDIRLRTGIETVEGLKSIQERQAELLADIEKIKKGE